MIEASVTVPLVAPLLGDLEIAAAIAVLRSGHIAQGPEVAAFEREFAAEIGVAHAVAMNSGTAANHAALAALGIADGDEVLCTPFTFAASATPIVMLRAIPRFVDIDPRTFVAEPGAALAAATSRTKAAVLVDLFGLPIDPSGANALRARGIALVEDACQAIGARRASFEAGQIGDVASFSFYATKNVTTGEGGMLVTDRAEVAEAARRFRQHGMSLRYEYLSLGYNYRMTDLAAAIGRVQLGRLAEFTSARRTNAAFYDAAFADLPGVSVPLRPSDVAHAYHQYSLLIDPEVTRNGCDRDALREALSARHVASGVYYSVPLHLTPLFAPYGYGPGDFPIAERVARQIVALPVHPGLDRKQLEWTVRAVREAVGAKA